MLVLRWMLSLYSAAVTYVAVLFIGVITASHIHENTMVVFTIVFILCGLSAIGAAVICVPERLRLTAAKTLSYVLLTLIVINVISCVQDGK